MEYLSHTEYTEMLSKFGKETPKGLLKEEVQEGNAFTKQLHTHKPGEKFKVGGKSYKDTAKGVVPEYRFDQMYPDDPGPFEGKGDVCPVCKQSPCVCDTKEENLDLTTPDMKPTGQTIQTVENSVANPPYGFSVLSPDERKQLKEYIQSYKTIKSEIGKLLEKAGKSGKIMETTAAEKDEKIPAAMKPKYQEPTKKEKPGGDRTGIVLKKDEMWEMENPDLDPKHQEIESHVDARLHDAFHKVADKIIDELVASGFTRYEALAFLDQEMAEKNEEHKMSQYDL